MEANKENIWHFTCDYCQGFWSVATMDEWKPKELYCTPCVKLNKNDDGKFSEAKFKKEEWCSCGHRIIDCDCKPGCECGCNSKFLGAY
jgi:hypothetical protein